MRHAAQTVGNEVIWPWQVRRCRGLWLPEEPYVIRDGSNRVSYVESLTPARKVPLQQSNASARPTWNASNAAWNGRPTLDLNGTSDWMQSDALASLVSGEDRPFTVMLACDFADVGNSEGLWSIGGSGGFHVLRRRGDDLDRSERRDDGNVQVTVADGFPVSAAPAIHTIVFTGTFVSWYRNGSLLIDGSQDVGVLTVTLMTWGARRGGGVLDFLGGSIAGAAFWPAALTDTERRISRTFFARRFAL